MTKIRSVGRHKKQILLGSSGGGTVSTSVVYGVVTGHKALGGSEGGFKHVFPVGGKLRKLYVKLGTAPDCLRQLLSGGKCRDLKNNNCAKEWGEYFVSSNNIRDQHNGRRRYHSNRSKR